MFFDINNINHAYLVVSKNTEYAYSQVKEFVEKILNSNDLSNNVDYKLIESEDGKSIKINQIRDMQSDVAIKPIKGDRKIYVIVDADKMNEQAQNCILKTLEEPPLYASIFLITAFPEKLIDTVNSRVKRVKIDGENEIKEFERVKSFIDNMNNISDTDKLKFADYFADNKDDFRDILKYMIVYYHELIQKILSSEQKSDTITCRKLSENISVCEKCIEKLDRNCNFNMIVDYLLINLN